MTNDKLRKQHRYKDQQQIDRIKLATQILMRTSTGSRVSFSSFVVGHAEKAAAELIKKHPLIALTIKEGNPILFRDIDI